MPLASIDPLPTCKRREVVGRSQVFNGHSLYGQKLPQLFVRLQRSKDNRNTPLQLLVWYS
jgi:hypothetical protein